ncbi:MAG: hypothetical protein R2713_05800 [Ilumatobacteraceae bacterium]
MIDAPPKYFRLTPGREVRLRGAYFVTCTGYVTGDDGEVVEVHATYDLDTRWQRTRRAQGQVDHALVRRPHTPAMRPWRCTSACSPPRCRVRRRANHSTTCTPPRANCSEHCKVEAAVTDTAPGQVVQFERLGYFAHDPREHLLFHRTVGLKDEWANIQKRT